MVGAAPWRSFFFWPRNCLFSCWVGQAGLHHWDINASRTYSFPSSARPLRQNPPLSPSSAPCSTTLHSRPRPLCPCRNVVFLKLQRPRPYDLWLEINCQPPGSPAGSAPKMVWIHVVIRPIDHTFLDHSPSFVKSKLSESLTECALG